MYVILHIQMMATRSITLATLVAAGEFTFMTLQASKLSLSLVMGQSTRLKMMLVVCITVAIIKPGSFIIATVALKIFKSPLSFQVVIGAVFSIKTTYFIL